MTKAILGHIDCPTCGTPKAMRITPDKNGAPFGFCEDGCGQQLRVGGHPRRERLFLARYPWAAAPVTVTVPDAAPATAPAVAVPVPVPKPVPATVPAKVAPKPAPAPAKAGFWTPLMGGANG